MRLMLNRAQSYNYSYIRTLIANSKRGLEEFVERSSFLHETGMWEENGATEA